jgi:hypothetical protein
MGDARPGCHTLWNLLVYSATPFYIIGYNLLVMMLFAAADLMTQVDEITLTIGNAMTLLAVGLAVAAAFVVVYIILRARGSD